MNKKPSLLKQFVGALIGAALALALYSGYKTTAPHLKAYIQIFTTREESARFAQTNLDIEDRQYERRVARNQEIVRRFAAPIEETPGYENDEVIESIIERAREAEERLNDVPLDFGEDMPMEEEVMREQESDMVEQVEDEVLMEETELEQKEEEIWMNEENVEHSEAETLPDSGIAATASALAALVGSSVVVARKKRKEEMA